MPTLTPEAKASLSEIAKRNGLSEGATTQLFEALVRGNGTMAQFNHAEVGGSGQWMRGGMIMVGDMFNDTLKSRVSTLFNDLSALYEKQPFTPDAPKAANSSSAAKSSTDEYGVSSAWGQPSSTGSQNDSRYAFYPQAHRLLVVRNDESWVYDTQDHQISGVQQQNDWAMTFTSQKGTIDLNALPVVMQNGQPI